MVDRKAQAVSRAERITEARDPIQESVWLVRFKDEDDSLAHVFDFKTETDLGKVVLPKGYDRRSRRARLSPKRDFVAIFDELGWQAMQRSAQRTVATQFYLFDLSKGSRRELPVVVDVKFRNTSGLPQHYVDFEWGFSADGASFRYVSAKKEGVAAAFAGYKADGWEVVSVNWKDGQLSRTPYGQSVLPASQASAPPVFYVPPYLDRSKIRRARDVVSGLLDLLGIEHNVRYGPRGSHAALTASYTEDGKRFLANIPLPNGKNRWMYGDLEGRKVRPVDAPPTLFVGLGNIHAVVVPGKDVPMRNKLPRYLGE